METQSKAVIDLAESLRSVLLLQLFHSCVNSITDTICDANGNVVSCHLFYSGKDDSFTALTLPNNGIDFPMANLSSLVNNDRPLFNAAAFDAFVLTASFAMLLAAQSLWDIESG